MSWTPLESDGRAAASKAERAGSIPARGTSPGARLSDAAGVVSPNVYWWRPSGLSRISTLTPDGPRIEVDAAGVPTEVLSDEWDRANVLSRLPN